MILAGIDIGTNTLRLLVAELGPDTFRELYSDRKITRLGQDVDRTGRLSQEAEERSLNALAEFARHFSEYSVIDVSAVGTSALRNASNAADFVKRIQQRTGLEVSVIDGDEEARLTLLGVNSALGRATGAGQGIFPEAGLVIDIGGGSTEMIFTRPGSETLMRSLPLGAVYLTERFIKNDPPKQEELEGLRRFIVAQLDALERELRRDSQQERSVVGTAGTITTLAAIDLGLAEYDPDAINGHILSREALDRIVRTLGASTLRERRMIAGLEHGREDIILSGAIIAQEIMERRGCPELLVTVGGLREGIVLELYRKLQGTR